MGNERNNESHSEMWSKLDASMEMYAFMIWFARLFPLFLLIISFVAGWYKKGETIISVLAAGAIGGLCIYCSAMSVNVLASCYLTKTYGGKASFRDRAQFLKFKSRFLKHRRLHSFLCWIRGYSFTTIESEVASRYSSVEDPGYRRGDDRLDLQRRE